MIIDSSAIVAIFFRESGAEEILAAIVEADFAGIGSPTATETGLVLTAALGETLQDLYFASSKRAALRSCPSPIFTGSEPSTPTPDSAKAVIQQH